MNPNNYQDLVREFIQKYVEDELKGYLNNRLSNNGETLTLIGNEGAHSIPSEYLHGEVYVVTSGSLDLSSKDSTLSEYKIALSSLIKKFKGKDGTTYIRFLLVRLRMFFKLKLLCIIFSVLALSTCSIQREGISS